MTLRNKIHEGFNWTSIVILQFGIHFIGLKWKLKLSTIKSQTLEVKEKQELPGA